MRVCSNYLFMCLSALLCIHNYIVAYKFVNLGSFIRIQIAYNIFHIYGVYTYIVNVICDKIRILENFCLLIYLKLFYVVPHLQ